LEISFFVVSRKSKGKRQKAKMKKEECESFIFAF